MYEQIVTLLGGRVAEKQEYNDISTGASNDLQRATKIAHDMVAKFGMSARIGSVSYDNDDEIFVGRDYERTKSYSEQTGAQIDEEVKEIIDSAYAQCAQILSDNADKLHQIADYLLEHETMSRKQFEACMRGEPIPETAESFFDETKAEKPAQDARKNPLKNPDPKPPEIFRAVFCKKKQLRASYEQVGKVWRSLKRSMRCISGRSISMPLH